MFGKVKELYEMKKKADQMKKEMEAIHLTIDEGSISIRIRGDQHFEEIVIDGRRDERLRDILNKAVKESQKKVAKKMQGQMKDFGL